jgi:Fe-S cluster assembly protein SufD
MNTTTEVLENKNGFLVEFENFEEKWAGNGSSWLLPVRKAAIARFNELGIPALNDEDWRQTNLKPIRENQFSRAPEAVLDEQGLQLLESMTVEGEGSNRLVFVNGRYSEEHSRLNGLKEGVVVSSLAEALKKGGDRVRSNLSKIAGYDEHAFVALNTAFIEDGAYIHLSENVNEDKPFQLVYISTGGDEAVVSHPRNLIYVESGSRLSVIESYGAVGEGFYLTNAVTEVVLEKDAKVDHYKLQLESLNAFHIASTKAHQAHGSKFENHNISVGGKLIRNDIGVVLDDENSVCTLNGLYLGVGEQHIDNHTDIDHAKPNCNSFELYKGILDDKASSIFKGKILVRQDAQKTDAVQSNHGLLLSETANLYTRPQLEIYADDVKCTHGATVGEIDEDAVFYLRSRGIDEKSARAIMIAAFANELVDDLELESVRNAVGKLIEMRFYKNH